jgi:hypothetical protein
LNLPLPTWLIVFDLPFSAISAVKYLSQCLNRSSSNLRVRALRQEEKTHVGCGCNRISKATAPLALRWETACVIMCDRGFSTSMKP